MLYPALLLSNQGLIDNPGMALKSPFSDQAAGQTINGVNFYLKTKTWAERIAKEIRDPFDGIGDMFTTSDYGGLPTTIRHEIGHTLYENYFSEAAKRQVYDVYRKYVMADLSKRDAGYDYLDAQAEGRKIMSSWAGMSQQEFFAEAFALISDPNYHYRRFPKNRKKYGKGKIPERTAEMLAEIFGIFDWMQDEATQNFRLWRRATFGVSY
jgi:hypothetical protein